MLIFSLNTSLAQGWVAPSSNVLAPYNSSLGLTPINIGIGLTTSTEQLHTNGGVRFTGLIRNDSAQRVVVQDLNGKLFYKNASTIGGNFWSLAGNAGTVPGTGTGQNFLGTKDANRLVIATNNTEWMTVLLEGKVGISRTKPSNKLEVIGDTRDDRDQQVGIGGKSPSIRMFGGAVSPLRAPRTWGTLPYPYAKIGLATLRNDYVINADTGDLVIQTISKSRASIIFSNYFDSSRADGIEQMRLNGNGLLGIGTSKPTARLHVLCSKQPINKVPSDVRFENISYGSGEVLVVDQNGYVFRSRSKAATADPTEENSDDLAEAVANLQREVNYLLAQNEALRKGGAAESLSDISVYPNPASNSTTVELKNNPSVSNAMVQVFDAAGKMIYNTSSNFGMSHKADINTTSFIPGEYLIKVIGDKKLIGAKSIVIIK